MAKQITPGQAFNIRGLEIGNLLDAYEVPKGKIEAVVTYYGTLLAKNKQMSNQRIVRKTVEYFKLKKKEVVNEPNV